MAGTPAPDTILLNALFGQVSVDALLITPPGGTQGTLQNFINGGTGLPSESVTNGITASTTQTLAGALALTSALSVVSTVGTAGDAVKLPPVAINTGFAQFATIINNGASALSIFPNESATAIDSHATAAAATLTAAHRAFFFQNSASTWVSIASVSAAS